MKWMTYPEIKKQLKVGSLLEAKSEGSHLRSTTSLKIIADVSHKHPGAYDFLSKILKYNDRNKLLGWLVNADKLLGINEDYGDNLTLALGDYAWYLEGAPYFKYRFIDLTVDYLLEKILLDNEVEEDYILKLKEHIENPPLFVC